MSKLNFVTNIWRKLFRLFKLTTAPVVKVYHGYGNQEHCMVFGHVFTLSPIQRKKYTQSTLINALAMLRLFMVKTRKGATVRLTWEGKTYTAITESDGFFRFEWKPENALAVGWHPVKVELIHPLTHQPITHGDGAVFIPYNNQFGFISDIDDTFLISHSSKIRKRLYVLLTKNAHSRIPFEGVVNHYRLLSLAHAPANTTNPFFYVSSSEWNLYNFINDFSRKNGLPKGIFLLSQIKKLKDVLKTGQNKHATKFMRIARVLEAYPHHKFVLLGDDTQEDPSIYASIAEHFQHRIFAVYIRQVEKRNKESVQVKIHQIENAGVRTCYFAHSKDAMEHSRRIGLIDDREDSIG